MYSWRNPGLGVFNPPPRPAFIDPGYPADAAIVAQNTANNNAYQAAMDVAQATNNYDQCEANAQNANSQAQYDEVMARCRGQAAIQAAPDVPTVTYYTPGKITPPVYDMAAPPTSASLAPPSVGLLNVTQGKDFTNGGTFNVGDRWRIVISDAAANQPVIVSATQDGASLGSSTVGRTSAIGLFQLDGVMDANTVGRWVENYSVPGGPSGYPTLPNLAPLSKSISFTVARPAAQGAGSGAGSGSGSGSGSGTGSETAKPAKVAGFDLSSVPWWGWLAGAGVAVMAFGNGGRR